MTMTIPGDDEVAPAIVMMMVVAILGNYVIALEIPAMLLMMVIAGMMVLLQWSQQRL